MTEYRRIDADTFQELQPAGRVRISELQRQRNDADRQIIALEGEVVKNIPGDLPDAIRQIVLDHNRIIESQLAERRKQKSRINNLIARLRAIRASER